MKRSTLYSLVITLLLAGCSFADMIVGLNANGELWRGDTANIAGTKTLLATLTGTGYIDSAFDGQYLYGLRNDGTVYRSDLSGNVSAVAVTGWNSSVHSINADSGTLYGMGIYGADVAVKKADGTAVVTLVDAAATKTYSDLTVTDDGLIWVLLTRSAGNDLGYGYAYTSGYSGGLSGHTNFFNVGNIGSLGLALSSDGTELYGSYKNGTVNSRVKYTTGGAVTPNLDSASFSTGLADMDKGSTLFGVLASGAVESLALNNSAAVSLGTLSGAGTVGLEVIPEPATIGLFGFTALSLLVFRRRYLR